MSAGCDLLVIGSGAAGPAAAVTGTNHGLPVIRTGKDSVLGGTGTWSGGWIRAPGHLVCAHSGRARQRRCGQGLSRPFPVPIRPWLRPDCLRQGRSSEDLAVARGMDPAGLRATLDRRNLHAVRGAGPDLHRGGTADMRLQGDPTQGANSPVAPIDRPPCLAVKLGPGSFGTLAGIEAEEATRDLRCGAPVPGLDAAGREMAPVMGSFHRAGKNDRDPALTFGQGADLHAAHALERPQ